MTKKSVALVASQYRVPFVLLTSLFFLWGFAHAILDVLNKHFQELLAITRAHSALIQATMYMGYFVMAIPAGMFITRWGYRQGVVFGLLLYGIGSLLFIPGQYMMSFNMFLFSLFVIGCGLVFLETAANPYVTELGARETAASRLNFAQSFNGLGCILRRCWPGCCCFLKKIRLLPAMLPYHIPVWEWLCCWWHWSFHVSACRKLSMKWNWMIRGTG